MYFFLIICAFSYFFKFLIFKKSLFTGYNIFWNLYYGNYIVGKVDASSYLTGMEKHYNITLPMYLQ